MNQRENALPALALTNADGSVQCIRDKEHPSIVQARHELKCAEDWQRETEEELENARFRVSCLRRELDGMLKRTNGRIHAAFEG